MLHRPVNAMARERVREKAETLADTSTAALKPAGVEVASAAQPESTEIKEESRQAFACRGSIKRHHGRSDVSTSANLSVEGSGLQPVSEERGGKEQPKFSCDCDCGLKCLRLPLQITTQGRRRARRFSGP
jgi:hypothetical protein